jgi:hypothetical protein
MSIGLTQPLPSGDYQVAWSNVSARDGDPDQGRFGFTVGPAGTVAAPDCAAVSGELAEVGGFDASTASDADGSGLPMPVIVAGAVVVIAAVGAFLLLRRKGTAGPA